MLKEQFDRMSKNQFDWWWKIFISLGAYPNWNKKISGLIFYTQVLTCKLYCSSWNSCMNASPENKVAETPLLKVTFRQTQFVSPQVEAMVFDFIQRHWLVKRSCMYSQQRNHSGELLFSKLSNTGWSENYDDPASYNQIRKKKSMCLEASQYTVEHYRMIK
jgi:hypothetical protein